jgi:hypothetical protein
LGIEGIYLRTQRSDFTFLWFVRLSKSTYDIVPASPNVELNHNIETQDVSSLAVVRSTY